MTTDDWSHTAHWCGHVAGLGLLFVSRFGRSTLKLGGEVMPEFLKVLMGALSVLQKEAPVVLADVEKSLPVLAPLLINTGLVKPDAHPVLYRSLQVVVQQLQAPAGEVEAMAAPAAPPLPAAAPEEPPKAPGRIKV